MDMVIAAPVRLDTPGSASSGSPVEAARTLQALIRDESEAIERSGTVSDAVVGALRETRLFWMLVPKQLGGGGASLTAAVEAIEELSYADASVGWSLMANATSTAIAATYCGDAAVDAMFGGAEPAITAGMFGPGGKAAEVPGGFRAAGRFAFGSGCAHANWISAGMFIMEEGKPRALKGGLPEVQVCFVPREKVNFLGGWDVAGLSGTGSYDYEIPEQFIGREFALERSTLEPLRGGSLFTLGLGAFACAGHGAVALGLMKRALTEVVSLAAQKKRPGYPSTIGEYPLFTEGFSRSEALYNASRGYLLQVFEDAQTTAAAGGQLSPEQRARFRQAATWVHEVAADVVGFCYKWGGSTAIRTPSALGRCMRDMSVATQHVFVDPITLVDAAPPIMAAWKRD
jgi:alkylation response protein AidB-like acyl-CoA dehydrogenase